jgi:hypothetical protein
MFEHRRLAVDAGLAEQIQHQRGLDYRRRYGAGWQSIGYTGQPFPWFESTYRAVEAEAGSIDTWWFNANLQGEGTGWHSHSQWARVGVLYVQVPAGLIEFKKGGAYWTETPQAGDLLVFPGSLEHRVRSNTSEQVRISVAFNFKKR